MEEKFVKVIELFKEKAEKECYAISVLAGEPTILDDKIGGKPYLPIGVDYPKDENNNYMPLLLQVNLKNIDLKGYPNQGILEIFTDKDVAYPCQYVIKYFEEGLDYQMDLPEIDTSYYITTKPLKIELTKAICHMPLNDYRFLNIISTITSEVYGSNITNYSQLEKLFADADWYESFSKALTNHTATIGGYPILLKLILDVTSLRIKMNACLN